MLQLQQRDRKLNTKTFCDKLVDELKGAGLHPGTIKRAVIDGEGMFDEEDARWRKKFWARV